jgi:hypothetical protein
MLDVQRENPFKGNSLKNGGNVETATTQFAQLSMDIK